MRKKPMGGRKASILIASLVIVSLVVYFAVGYYDPYYIVFQANKHIQVEGLKLMMKEDKVIELMGKEGEKMPGFGGYARMYQDKGIYISIPSDRDAATYLRIGEIVTSNPSHAIYGIHVGDGMEDAGAILRKYGYEESEDAPGYYQKGNLYVVLSNDSGSSIQGIRVGIRDKKTKDRIY